MLPRQTKLIRPTLTFHVLHNFKKNLKIKTWKQEVKELIPIFQMTLLQLSIDGDSVQTVAVMESEFCLFIKMKFLFPSNIETESKENTI